MSDDPLRKAKEAEKKLKDQLRDVRAIKSRLAGEPKTAAEKRDEWLATAMSCPKSYYEALTGLHRETILNLARRDGLPLGESSVDIGAVLRWFHERFTEWKRQPAEFTEDDLFSDAESPALERFRAARAEMVEMDLEERRREIVKRSEVREAHNIYASAIRSAGDALVKRFGNEAADILNDAIERGVGAVVDRFGEGETSEP